MNDELDIQQERQAFEQRYKVNHNKVEYDEKRDCYEPLTHNKKTQWAYAKETNIRWGTWKSAKRHTLKSNNWISVNNRLPENGQNCLAWKEPRSSGYGSRGYIFSTFDNGVFDDIYPNEIVTHWQPLPNPPMEIEK